MRGRSAMLHLLRSGRRFRDPSGTVQTILLGDREAQEPIALALMVSRTVCPTAVGRNRLRRLLRESIRTLARQQPELLAPYRAIAIRWLRAVTVDYRRLRLRDVLPMLGAALQTAEEHITDTRHSH
ncbi:MAG: ribonuclease P protein component [Chlorobi bacterium]|nr:ribonuclease P protein component [Chlorobiota bacterium]